MCLVVALDVLVLPWFDLLLLCTSHTHVHRTGTQTRASSTAAVLSLLLCCCFTLILWRCEAEWMLLQQKKHRSSCSCCVPMTAHTSRTEAHIRTHKEHRPWLSQKSAAAAALHTAKRVKLAKLIGLIKLYRGRRNESGAKTKIVRGERAIRKYPNIVGFFMHLRRSARRNSTP